MRILTLQIDERTAGRTVKNLLKRELALSVSLITHLKYRPNGITCNGKPVRTVDKLCVGDLLAVDVSDDISEILPATPGLPLSVLYEDEDLLVIEKPAGMEVHPDEDQLRNPSVKDSVLQYLGAGAVFHPVNRLDVETSGILVAAKHRYACDRLRNALHTEDFVREYLALCCGKPKQPRGTLQTPVNGLPAQTHYTVLAESGENALLRLRLTTGRTHQIRIHLAEIGCPILGDGRYGTPDSRICRTALHSAAISLVHPVSGERIRIFAPPPQDFCRAAERLGIPADFLTEARFYVITD